MTDTFDNKSDKTSSQDQSAMDMLPNVVRNVVESVLPPDTDADDASSVSEDISLEEQIFALKKEKVLPEDWPHMLVAHYASLTDREMRQLAFDYRAWSEGDWWPLSAAKSMWHNCCQLIAVQDHQKRKAYLETLNEQRAARVREWIEKHASNWDFQKLAPCMLEFSGPDPLSGTAIRIPCLLPHINGSIPKPIVDHVEKRVNGHQRHLTGSDPDLKCVGIIPIWQPLCPSRFFTVTRSDMPEILNLKPYAIPEAPTVRGFGYPTRPGSSNRRRNSDQ